MRLESEPIEIPKQEFNRLDSIPIEMPKQEIKEEPKSRIVEPKRVTESKPFETKPKDFNDVVSTALNEAILPSKSPLPQDDPFNYFTSKNYLQMFVIASAAFVFVISLFD
jgi:hypothetical protein